MNKILDNIIFEDKLNYYFNNIDSNNILLENNKVYNSNAGIFKDIPIDIVNIVDDYKDECKIHSFENVKFNIKNDNSHGFNWRFSPVGIDKNGKIINITNKLLSYFSILSFASFNAHFIRESYNELNSSTDFTIIEDDVFLFLDCFPLASVHNLDDIYNLLYYYKINNLNCKLLVLKTNDFYYNQSLDSLKKYFNLEYIYLEVNKNYLFKNFKCVRQYHWIQPDALKFIHKNYIDKICEGYKGQPIHDNISIIKTIHQTNASTWDTFEMTQNYINLMFKKNIFNIDNVRENLEYKIYLINNAKNIITSYLSPFNINLYKHCSRIEEKNIIVLNNAQKFVSGTIVNDFKYICMVNNQNIYDFYGIKIHGNVIDIVNSLDEVEQLINF